MTDSFNEVYINILYCLGELTKEEVKTYKSKIPYGKRLYRYFDTRFD